MIKDLMIGAIPSEHDPVWDVSSEKVPHLTILYLGDQPDTFDIGHVFDYVQHAVNTSLRNFTLPIDRRGKLGDKNADVVFFEKGFWTKELEEFRSHLLKDELIFKAYNAIDQFPEWTPHLTLGYPETPASDIPKDVKSLYSVGFDRIAVWTGEYEGPEILLNSFEEVMAMSESADDVLSHFGVKGMKWGIRKDSTSSGGSGKTTAKADKKWEKKASRNSTMFKVYNSAAARMNKTEVSRINNKPQYKNKDFTVDSPLRRKYYKEYNDTFTKIMNEEASRIIGTNPSGTKRVRFDADDNGDISIHYEDVKHADNDVIFVAKTNENGYIVSISVASPVLEQSVISVGEEFIKHYGIKGMKWGVRRRSPSGNSGEVEVRSGDGRKIQTRGGAKRDASEDAIRSAVLKQVAKKSTTDALSTRQLQELVTRMNLEQQYSRLRPKRPSEKVASFLSATLLGIGKEQASKYAREAVTSQLNDVLKKS